MLCNFLIKESRVRDARTGRKLSFLFFWKSRANFYSAGKAEPSRACARNFQSCRFQSSKSDATLPNEVDTRVHNNNTARRM